MTLAAGLLAGLILFMGVAPVVRAESETNETRVRIEKIVLLPFFKGRSEMRSAETVALPIDKLYYISTAVAGEATQVLTDLVYVQLKARFEDRLAAPAAVDEVLSGLPKDDAQDTIRSRGQAVGTRLGANAVFAGSVWTYKERVGNAFSIQSPASVAFGLYLLDVKSGALLWSARYEETQKSLLENLLNVGLFMERGGKWVTVDKLAAYGVKHLFRKFPYGSRP